MGLRQDAKASKKKNTRTPVRDVLSEGFEQSGPQRGQWKLKLSEHTFVGSLLLPEGLSECMYAMGEITTFPFPNFYRFSTTLPIATVSHRPSSLVNFCGERNLVIHFQAARTLLNAHGNLRYQHQAYRLLYSFLLDYSIPGVIGSLKAR